VVRAADGLRLRAVAREVNDLAQRARSKQLGPDEIMGGTFTITNMGPFGTLFTVPIINQPQVAILATDAVKKRPVVVEGPDGDDAIAVHSTGVLTLSWDHRAFDGAYAASFLHSLTEILERRDWEAELAVVIGTRCRDVSETDALDMIFGYTCLNDVTARDWQSRHSQWLLGKSFDTFCPMGPWLVSADEMDGTKTSVRCFVNGEKRQDANTTDLIFDIPVLIETLSAGITLYPGDIIATGTPVGVGIGFKPPKYLKPGDVVRVEIDGIGALENPVR